MLTLLYYPQWQGGARSVSARDGAVHLRAQLLRQAGETPVTEIAVPIRPDEERYEEAGIAYRATILEQLRAAQTRLEAAAPSHFVTIGGDCGIETVPIGYANALVEGRMALVFVDAHGDLNTPQSSTSHHYHGMSLRALCGEGDADFVASVGRQLTPQQVFMVGPRDLEAGEEAFLTEHQVYHTATPDLPGLMEAIKARGYTHVYVHFDMDGLDPQEFPYTNYPAPGGLSIAQLTEMIAALRQNFNVIGMSMTEYHSPTGEGVALLDPVFEQAVAIGQS